MENITPKIVGNATIEKATLDDVPSIKLIVDAAYSKYIPRMGRPPAPMTQNYETLLTTEEVYVLRANFKVAGAICLTKGTDSIIINNLVVDPTCQGQGYGRFLMHLAEEMAKADGLNAITLYTNVKMFENIGLYGKLGFVETDRRMENGFDRVFFRKDLA